MVKRVYTFREGTKEMKDLLGGKGANLSEMTNLGLKVPPGFIITTNTCNDFLEAKGKFPEGLWMETLEHVLHLQENTGKRLNDSENPLLVSVRSGAPISMPGMMDTILNLGLNDGVAKTLVELTGDEWFVYDSYRRLITMFGNVVMRAERGNFDAVHELEKEKEGVKNDTDISIRGLKRTVEGMKKVYQKVVGSPFPTDPYEQLKLAIAAVFNSWNTPRAITYRKAEGIPDEIGTACNVQTMVFGNMGWDSGSGVLFTRDPGNGENDLFGEFIFNAQGEDVVAGIRTPIKLVDLKQEHPQHYEALKNIAEKLEDHFTDMQDVEFTIEKGVLYILQTRTGKRTARAHIKIAVDMANEGIIDKETAIMRITPDNIDQILHPQFAPSSKEEARQRGDLLTVGLSASPGAASGMIIFDADRAEESGKQGNAVIMVRPETTPDDVNGMIVSQGFLTQHGGGTSHAAVVARGWGKPCVAGAEEIRINTHNRLFTVKDRIFKEGDIISIDGATGEVFAGIIETMIPQFEEEVELSLALKWADEIRRLGVQANADTPEDARRARLFGATGIGLARTEHMFFDKEGEKVSRRENIVKMILQSDTAAPILRKIIDLENRLEVDPCNKNLEAEIKAYKVDADANPAVQEYRASLETLLPFQRKDFEGIFEEMDGYPVIIRLIDPPMHEFLPPRESLIEKVTTLRCTGENPEELAEREAMLMKVESMWETNPMLGLRGCRAGLMYPGLTEMQTRALFEAACNKAKEGFDVHPKVMIPITSHVNELQMERGKLEKEAIKVMAEKGIKVDYMFGTMIEIPRAALTADKIAKSADFFSFGTNDLTQMTYGLSRDDAEGKFLLNFVERGLLPGNPFKQLDWDGVGQLMSICVEKGRETKPGLEVGICGEHGGDPSSIEFCHIAGLDYVSCSPFRVPVARLAAAQSELKHRGD